MKNEINLTCKSKSQNHPIHIREKQENPDDRQLKFPTTRKHNFFIMDQRIFTHKSIF